MALELTNEQKKAIWNTYREILENCRLHKLPFTAYVAGILNFEVDAFNELTKDFRKDSAE